MSAALECKSLVASSIARASHASAEDFRDFLQTHLRPEDSQEIVWADILLQEESQERKGWWFSSLWSRGRRRRRAAAARESTPASPKATGVADETRPWRMMLKLPLLSALEVLGIHSQFRVALPRTRGVSPVVLCGLAGKKVRGLYKRKKERKKEDRDPLEETRFSQERKITWFFSERSIDRLKIERDKITMTLMRGMISRWWRSMCEGGFPG